MRSTALHRDLKTNQIFTRRDLNTNRQLRQPRQPRQDLIIHQIKMQFSVKLLKKVNMSLNSLQASLLVRKSFARDE